jgi:membrane protein implicated in regulation of membrane protease activity
MHMDMSWFSLPVFWLVAAVVFALIEGLTMGLTTIWFAGGAVVALIAALLGAGPGVQIVLFFVVSIGLLLGTRRLFINKLHTGQEKTNVDALIGQEAVVLSAIRPHETGCIKLGGQEWSAVCRASQQRIEAGTTVTVTEIEGVKAIVVPSDENSSTEE